MTAAEPRRRLPAADRREQILAVAEDLFVARGFEAVNMGDLAGALGVSRPTVYSYFASPEAVLEALLEARLHELWARLAPLLAHEGPQAGLFATLFRFLLRERATLLLLHSGGGPRFQARRRAFLAELGARIEPLRRPQLAQVPELLPILTTLLDGLSFDALAAPGLDPERLATVLDTFVRGGLAALTGPEGPSSER